MRIDFKRIRTSPDSRFHQWGRIIEVNRGLKHTRHFRGHGRLLQDPLVWTQMDPLEPSELESEKMAPLQIHLWNYRLRCGSCCSTVNTSAVRLWQWKSARPPNVPSSFIFYLFSEHMGRCLDASNRLHTSVRAHEVYWVTDGVIGLYRNIWMVKAGNI